MTEKCPRCTRLCDDTKPYSGPCGALRWSRTGAHSGGGGGSEEPDGDDGGRVGGNSEDGREEVMTIFVCGGWADGGMKFIQQ